MGRPSTGTLHTGQQKCCACGIFKTSAQFGSSKAYVDGRQRACKLCMSARWRNEHKKKYGLDQELFDLIALEQDGKCAACGEVPGGKRPQLFVDHNHKTKRLRGLLCGRCNSGLGFFDESPDKLERATLYLQLRDAS